MKTINLNIQLFLQRCLFWTGIVATSTAAAQTPLEAIPLGTDSFEVFPTATYPTSTNTNSAFPLLPTNSYSGVYWASDGSYVLQNHLDTARMAFGTSDLTNLNNEVEVMLLSLANYGGETVPPKSLIIGPGSNWSQQSVIEETPSTPSINVIPFRDAVPGAYIFYIIEYRGLYKKKQDGFSEGEISITGLDNNAFIYNIGDNPALFIPDTGLVKNPGLLRWSYTHNKRKTFRFLVALKVGEEIVDPGPEGIQVSFTNSFVKPNGNTAHLSENHVLQVALAHDPNGMVPSFEMGNCNAQPDSLGYRVYFSNIGEAHTNDVFLECYIDNNLDINSFDSTQLQLITASGISHPKRVHCKIHPDKNMIWIHLEDFHLRGTMQIHIPGDPTQPPVFVDKSLTEAAIYFELAIKDDFTLLEGMESKSVIQFNNLEKFETNLAQTGWKQTVFPKLENPSIRTPINGANHQPATSSLLWILLFVGFFLVLAFIIYFITFCNRKKEEKKEKAAV